MGIDRDTVLSVDSVGGILTVDVSPCSWMYEGCGFQVRVVLKETGQWTMVRREDVRFSDASVELIREMAAAVAAAVKKCKCGRPRFDKAHSANRKTKCEKCFMADLNAKYEVDRAKEQAKIAAFDAKMKAKGATHKVVAWIHAGGDDKEITIYSVGELSEAKIKAELKRKRSRVLDDYRVFVL